MTAPTIDAPVDDFDLDIRLDVTQLEASATPQRNTQAGDSEFFCCTDACPTTAVH
jgi:hypothetical protein